VQGVDVKNDKIQIYADLIEKELGISCSSLSGANIANEGEHEFESGI
jgi:glycerol-3-phosphate dehydrogenase (NAD+)